MFKMMKKTAEIQIFVLFSSFLSLVNARIKKIIKIMMLIHDCRNQFQSHYELKTAYLAANVAKCLAHRFCELKLQNASEVESPVDRSDMQSSNYSSRVIIHQACSVTAPFLAPFCSVLCCAVQASSIAVMGRLPVPGSVPSPFCFVFPYDR